MTRGDEQAVYRVRLLDDGAARLERFDGGAFGPLRIFRGDGMPDGFDADEPNSTAKMDQAVRYIGRYLDGTVNVGERDLLSPTSVLTRNVRWFSGDIQMLGTAFYYVVELFPSAQFHVSQLFRRVFGDASFAALIVITSAFLLQTDSPVALRGLAITLQVVSMIAIVGVHRFVKPVRDRWQILRASLAARQGWRLAYLGPAMVVAQVVLGIVAVIRNTLIGVANMAIHPLKIFESWRSVRRGSSLDWRASSVSVVQDMRGWPLVEFVEVYRPATRAGIAIVVFACWLIALGAPMTILGLNGVGVFAAAFLTAAVYAWHSGLPRSADDGAPLYRLPPKEFGWLVLAGVLGLVTSAALWSAGIYPLPAFEGSAGVVLSFLTFTAAFALLYPTYYVVKRRALNGGPDGLRRLRRALLGAGVVAFGGVAAMVVTGAPALVAARRTLVGVVHLDAAAWRVPAAEQRVYDRIAATQRERAAVDPEPLLKSEGDQPTFQARSSVATVDRRELRGIPSPRLPHLAPLSDVAIPDLFPLPLRERIALGKPKREFLVPMGESSVEPPVAVVAGKRGEDDARARAIAATPRVLSRPEVDVEDAFVEAADYPWISRDELRALAKPNDRGERVPVVEMARAYRWDVLKAAWDRVPAAARNAAPARVRLDRLVDAMDGISSLGLDPAPEELERYLETELALIADYSRDFPHVPLTATQGAPFETTRFAQMTRFILQARTDLTGLARDLRLDYVDAYWDTPALGSAVHQIFRERARTAPWEKLELDWGGNETLRERWTDLETEQAVASRIWREGRSQQLATPAQLREIATFLETILERIVAEDATGPYSAFARLFRLEGVDEQALRSGDKVAALFASRLWTQTMSGRVARVVSRAMANTPLPGSPQDQALVQSIGRERYPDDDGDPLLRRLFDWLVVIDGIETYREQAAGYDKFFREMKDRGLRAQGLTRAPALGDDDLTRDLVVLWRTIPARFPRLPVRKDMVAEFIAENAYFSTPDGASRRTPRQFVDDFADLFRAVDEHMGDAPPRIIQDLADRQVELSQGRTSRDEDGRRFFAWWMCAQQAKILQNNLDRHARARRADVTTVAAEWADTLIAGQKRWPHLPWLSAGFGDFFLQVRGVDGLTAPALWVRFGRQLSEADELTARHVTPFESFTDLVDRRTEQSTGLPNFDPVLRQANAVLALAQLLHVARENGITGFEHNPALLTERFSLLAEKLARNYPHLDWDGEGTIEYYLLVELKLKWDLYHLVARFHPEWSLANALAGRGLLTRMVSAAEMDARDLTPKDRGLREFIDAQALRLEDRTGVRSRSARAKAMNALVALSTLILSAGEEGQIPDQHGEAWSKGRVLAWARTQTPASLTPATETWAEGLVADWGALYDAMRVAGPQFPWHKGAIVETNLLVMRNAAASVADMRSGLAPSWKVASDLTERRVKLPPAFEQMVLLESTSELRRKLALARSVPLERIGLDEVLPEDPALIPLVADLVLAEVVAEIRVRYREDPDPVALAERIVEVRATGPAKYDALPWSAKGFVPSLVVAAYERDFRDDFWKYVRFADLPLVNERLHEIRSADPAHAIPAEVMEDVRTIMRLQTGRTPSSDDVVAFQALRDGLFLLKEFVPQVPRDLHHTIAIIRLRAAVRGMSGDFPDLHIVTTEDRTVRVGFAERLAAVAMKQGIAAGYDPTSDAFVVQAVALLQGKFLQTMSKVYELVRASFAPEELAFYRESIRGEAGIDNVRRGAKYGVRPDALSTPDVMEDDVVADFALYEILYATEIGEDRSYLVDVFTIFDKIRRRPEFERAFREGIDSIDAPYKESIRPLGAPDHDRWVADPRYTEWLDRRGAFVKKARGRLTALARTLALLERAAFGPSADPEAKTAFSHFGGFDAYVGAFFDEFERVRRIPEFETALHGLEQEDTFLADGMHFALTIFALHVVDRMTADEHERARLMSGMASYLPAVVTDYADTLGFSPRLESGVPIYDARISFLRSDLQPGPGTDLLRRLNLMQRGVQRWREKYLVKHAYKVLFQRDLDEDDPTPVPREGWPRALRPLQTVLDRWFPRTRGQDVTAFLETRFPRALEKETGSRDAGGWVEWLAKNGEVSLEGLPTGQNPYADNVANYERRLDHYRALIERGAAAGTNVRAETQRMRDIDEELGSLRRQVDWLRRAATESVRTSGAARADYSRAVATSGAFFVVGLIFAAFATHRRATTGGVGRFLRALAFVLAIGAPLVLGVVAPIFAATNPARAAAVAERPLSRLGLLGRDESGTVVPRGAAAQLAKSRPWQVFSHARLARRRGTGS